MNAIEIGGAVTVSANELFDAEACGMVRLKFAARVVAVNKTLLIPRHQSL
jgi:hypothetical protein